LSFVAHFARSATFATISASEPSTPSARIVTLRSGRGSRYARMRRQACQVLFELRDGRAINRFIVRRQSHDDTVGKARQLLLQSLLFFFQLLQPCVE